MKDYVFRYGDGEVTVPLNEEQVLGVLTGNDCPPIEDIGAALYAAVEKPIDSAPLREVVKPGDRITMIVSDMSRFWMRQDLVVPHVVRYLHEECGAAYEQITIVIANGTHIGGDEQELRTLVTSEVYDLVKVVNHDCLAKDLVYIGTTAHGTPVEVNPYVANADLVIGVGAAVHHVMAGYGGGRKSIVPGVSSMQTIRANHAFSLDPKVLRSNPLIGNGVLEHNPLNEDMLEAAAMINRFFVINLVMNSAQKLAYLIAGHWRTSWEEACRTVDRIYRVPASQKADVIVTSCGGYPKDMSLYQGTKTIDNVETGLKLGGTLILLIEAREGGGPDEYFGWCRNLTDGTIEHRLRNEFTIPGYIFFLNCEQAQRYRVLMYSSVSPEDVKPMGIEAYSDMNELLAAANLEGKTIWVIPNGATVIPEVKEE